MAPNKTIMKSIIDIFFAIGSNFKDIFVAKFLKSIPNITGTVTIKNMSRDMLNKEISWVILDPPNMLTDVKTIKGIVKTHNKLIIAVKDIERATSPFEKEVSKLDVTPPGAAAIIITPIASSGFIDHIFTIIIH